MKHTIYNTSYFDGKPDKAILGGKGAGLVEMTQNGLPVPHAIIIPTSACLDFQERGVVVVEEMIDEIMHLVEALPNFGKAPLWAVRSGAPVSMPGMMDTILNVGANCVNHGLPTAVADDCNKRLDAMFLDVVGCHPGPTLKHQIFAAVIAVFKSWGNERAVIYREHNGIPHNMGTAVVIQKMVFGNMNDNSGSGVLFTRHPATGENIVMGEVLMNAQGEEVVAGTRTPKPLTELPKHLHEELLGLVTNLEKHYRDVQDVEFTIEDGTLYLLQTRAAKRTAKAAIKIAVDMEHEGLITRKEALARITGKQFLASRKPMIDPTNAVPAHVVGIAACNGVVTGVAKTPGNIEPGDILIAEETSPEHLGDMIKAAGVLTRTGGATSHAAVVARSLDKPCIVGATDLEIDNLEGVSITMDGSTGNVWHAENGPKIIDGATDEAVEVLIKWALAELAVTRKGAKLVANDMVVDVADWITEGKALAKMKEFRAAYKKLGKTKKVTLNLAGPWGYRDAGDARLWNLVGESYLTKEEAERDALINDLCDRPMKGLVINGASDEEVKVLVACGYKVARTVNNTADLLAAAGSGDPIAIDARFVEAAGSKEAAEAILKTFGKRCAMVKEAVTEEAAVFAVVGKE